MAQEKSPVAALMDLLDLERIEDGIYRGGLGEPGWKRVYGGQVIGQALVAAIRTVPADRLVHSLHAYFIRPGDPEIPIVYRVANDRDGKSFTTRRVVAIQHGKPIFNMAASFQVVEDGASHQARMPNVPPPEELTDQLTLRRAVADRIPEDAKALLLRQPPIEVRHVAPRDLFDPETRDPVSNIWLRVAEPIGDDLTLHQCMLAYASDMTLLETALFPHGIAHGNPKLQMASLDHAMWFHAPFRADDWILYSTDSPWSGGARGLTRGSFYTRDGVLVASSAQEGLIRLHR